MKLALALLISLTTLVAHAETTVTLGGAYLPPALEFTAEMLAGDPANDEKLAASWVVLHGAGIPSVAFEDGVAWIRDNQKPDEINKRLGKLVVEAIRFARGVSRDSKSFASDFSARFTRRILEKGPDFAWVVAAHRTKFELDTLEGERTGGAGGVQIPIVGWNNNHRDHDTATAVLRILPIAGNYEKVSFAKSPLDQVSSPESGFILRPTIELEAQAQIEFMTPGFRFLIQPKLDDWSQARMLAEAYIELEVTPRGSALKSMSIVPRCVMDLSNDHPDLGMDGQLSRAFSFGYRLLNSMQTCSVTAKFALDR